MNDIETLITVIIPSYNSKNHLVNTYKSIRKYYPSISLIIIDDASEDDTKKWLEDLQDDNVTPVFSEERRGHTYWYDEGMKMSATDVVSILHSDMMIGPNYFENMYKHMGVDEQPRPVRVVCATRVEPPIHPGSKEKIVKNFGVDHHDFQWEEFEAFCLEEQEREEDETTSGIFAPWMIHKSDHFVIGGHDQGFAPYGYEDSDIFNRWILAEYEMVQARDALVYHLTCRGHRWNKGIGIDNPDYKETMDRGARHFIRKWGQWIQNDEYQMPVIYPQYDIGLLLVNLNDIDILRQIEPWVRRVAIESEELYNQYLKEEQPRSKLNLTDRLLHYPVIMNVDTVGSWATDVVVVLDVSKATPEDWSTIQKMNLILEDLRVEMGKEFELTGDYELGNLKVRVNKLDNINKKNIIC